MKDINSERAVPSCFISVVLRARIIKFWNVLTHTSDEWLNSCAKICISLDILKFLSSKQNFIKSEEASRVCVSICELIKHFHVLSKIFQRKCKSNAYTYCILTNNYDHFIQSMILTQKCVREMNMCVDKCFHSQPLRQLAPHDILNITKGTIEPSLIVWFDLMWRKTPVGHW